MPTLVIGDKRVKVGDEFTKLSPEEQQSAVDEISRGVGGGPASDTSGVEASGRKAGGGGVTADNLVRAAARGIPIAGGAMDQFAAIMDAATHPVLGRGSDAASYGERKKANLEAERAKDKAFDEESPIASTGAKLAGGVVPFVGAAKIPQAASLLGFTGPLGQQVVRGGLSNAAIGGADAAVRGEDVKDAAESAGMVGMTLPVVGKALGKGYQAIRDRIGGSPPPVHQNVENIAGIDVPLFESEFGDSAKRARAASKIELGQKGAFGDAAQEETVNAIKDREAKLEQVRAAIADHLDPSGNAATRSPQQAGQAVVNETQRIAADRAAADAAAQAAADAEAAGLRGGMAGAAPGSAITAVRPGAAAESVGAGVEDAAQAAAKGRTAAYKAAEDIPAEFDPSVRDIGEQIRARLNTSDRPDRIWVDRDNATQASKALRTLSDQEGGIFHNEAAPGVGGAAVAAETGAVAPATAAAAPVDDTVAQIRAKFGPDVARKYEEQAAAKAAAEGIPPNPMAEASRLAEEGTPPAQPPADVKEALGPVRAKEIEAARKRLVTHYTDARNTYYRTGEGSDLRAMSAIMTEFDNVIKDMVKTGKVTGEGEAYLQSIEAARAAHASYRQMFSRQAGDMGVGQAIERIVGKGGQKLAPDEIAKAAWGSASNPGGGQTARVQAHLKKVLGADSEHWKQNQQGLFSYLVEKPDGGMRDPAEVAQRIRNFINSDHGSQLAKQVYTEPQRQQLLRYADTLEARVPQPKTRVEKLMSQISGDADGVPMSPEAVADKLLKGDQGLSVEAVKHMRQQFTPEGWDKLRYSIWNKLEHVPEGKLEAGAQARSQKMHEAINGTNRKLFEALYSPDELKIMKQLAATYRKIAMIDDAGAKIAAAPNNSNTTPALAKVVTSLKHTLLPMLGFAHGGLPGAAVAYGAAKAVEGHVNRKAVKEVQGALYGKQPKRVPGPSPTLALTKALARGSAMEAQRD